MESHPWVPISHPTSPLHCIDTKEAHATNIGAANQMSGFLQIMPITRPVLDSVEIMPITRPVLDSVEIMPLTRPVLDSVEIMPLTRPVLDSVEIWERIALFMKCY
jgi:hypothetical protein